MSTRAIGKTGLTDSAGSSSSAAAPFVFFLASPRTQSDTFGPFVRSSACAGQGLTAPIPTPSGAAPASRRFSFKDALYDWPKDAAQVWTYPFHIKNKDLLPLGILALTAAVLIPTDEATNRFLTDHIVDQDNNDFLSPLVSQMGSYGAWGTVGAFLAYGAIAKDDKAVETAGLAASAMVQSGLLVQVGKVLTGRRRPADGNGEDLWTGPAGYFRKAEAGQTARFNAFPSGHTATAFSLATVVAMQYRDEAWVPLVSYAMAAGVGLSRLSGNRHWLSDVVFGGVAGYVVARMVVRNYRRRHGVRPSISIGPASMNIAVSF